MLFLGLNMFYFKLLYGRIISKINKKGIIKYEKHKW